MARLIALSTDERQQFELGDLTSIGRHPNNTIQIRDGVVSKLHAQILRLPDSSFLLRDLGSLNGTFVRGKQVSEVRLEDGDLIRMGSTRLLFVMGSPSPTPLDRVTIGTASPDPGAPGEGPTVPGKGGAPPLAVAVSGPGIGEFPPAASVGDLEALRADYERLRLGHELALEIGTELDLRVVLQKILDNALRLSAADRGAILLVDLEGDLVPRFVRARAGRVERDIVLSPEVLQEVKRRKAGFISTGAGVGGGGEADGSYPVCLTVPFLHEEALLGVIHLESEKGSEGFTPKDLQVIIGTATRAAMAIQAAHLARKIERESQVRAQLARLVPPGVVEQVLRGEMNLDQRGRVSEVTVLHSDIQGFTAASGRESPEEIVRSLNESLEVMVEALFRHGGTLDRFVGDEIIGLFGAPVDLEDAPFRALECAWDMVRVLGEINQGRMSTGRLPLKLGVGIATGPAIVGAIGSTWALQYTAIGAPVKDASSLAARAGANELLLSEETYQQLRSRIVAEELPPTLTEGGRSGVRAFRVLARE